MLSPPLFCSILGQLPDKLPQIPPRSVLEILFQRSPVLVAVSPLDPRQQAPVPVQPHQARDQELVAEFVFGVVVAAVVAVAAPACCSSCCVGSSSVSYVYDCVVQQ